MARPRIRTLMGAITILAVLTAFPFQCRSSRQARYRAIANRYDQLAASFRLEERKARAKGDSALANKHRQRAERLENQGQIYQKAS